MKIKKLEIQNFRGLSEVTIDNFHDNLNLLIGVNGAGKSSVLDAIVLLLDVFTSRLTKKMGRGVRINPSDVKRGSIDGCTLAITLDNGVTWSKTNSDKLNSLTPGNYNELNVYTQGLRERLDGGAQINLPIIVHYGVKRNVDSIPLFNPSLLLTNDEALSNATYTNWSEGLVSNRDFFLWLREEEDYENELIRENPSNRSRCLEALREAMGKIFDDYRNLRVRRRPRLDFVLEKNDEELSLSQLSDGEKCYFALVCDIVRRLSIANPTRDILEGDGIVLIDEVDLHLHPSWETTVMEKLNYVFPNIQFIVTAHSPLVASHFDGHVYGMEHGNVTPLPRMYGLDYSEILMEYMNTRPDNRRISSLVDMYNSYKRHNMDELAEAVKNELLELMGGDQDARVFQKLI